MNTPVPNQADGHPDQSRSGELDASLRDAAASVNPSAVDSIAKARDIDGMERMRRAIFAAGEATYHWDIPSDRIVWSENAASILGIDDPAALSTGRNYADMLDHSNFASRFDAVMRSPGTDNGDGVAFSIEYMLQVSGPHGRVPIWIEDSGRWYAGGDGKPSEVFGTVRRIDARHERDEELLFRGYCDPLTGMMNRGRLSDTLAETIQRAMQNGTECAFLVAAIRNLSVVNDAYGFDVADEVIVAVGERLKRVVRAGDVIGRYSGGKFGIILSDCTAEEVRAASERFLNVARDSVLETERGPVWAMLSIGGVLLPKHASEANMAMACAEEALAGAKRLPSESYVGYEPSAERISVRSINARCAAEIVSSLKEDRFVLAYQPIIHAQSGAVAMHEALLRMRCSDSETVAALHLIPIAEKLGLVRLIDCEVAEMAMAALSANPDLALTLNVSGVTATDPRWFSQLTTILSNNSEVLDRLIVEITETMALQDLKETIKFTRSLREMGCKVAIDDFGAGYTSFKNLKELEVDMVKIDGSFCESLVGNQDNQYFVRSLIDLARKFDLLTVAEWVQTEGDADLLRSWGVDYMQGNLFGEAVVDVPWAVDRHVAAAEEARDEDVAPLDVTPSSTLFEAEIVIGHDELEEVVAKDDGDAPQEAAIFEEPIDGEARGPCTAEPCNVHAEADGGVDAVSSDAEEPDIAGDDAMPFVIREAGVVDPAAGDEELTPFVARATAPDDPSPESEPEPAFDPLRLDDAAKIVDKDVEMPIGDTAETDTEAGVNVVNELEADAIASSVSSLLQSARAVLDASFGSGDRHDHRETERSRVA